MSGENWVEQYVAEMDQNENGVREQEAFVSERLYREAEHEGRLALKRHKAYVLEHIEAYSNYVYESLVGHW